MLFAHIIVYFLSTAFFHDLTRIFDAHRNFAMRNFTSIDSNVKFHVMDNWSAMLNIINCFLLIILIVYCLMIFA